MSALRLTLLLLAALLCPTLARAADPLETIRDFCRADGLGARLAPPQWSEKVAPLVTWSLEPAWDRVKLVSGYQIGTPKFEGKELSVEVSYTIIAEVTADGVKREARVDTRTFRLASNDDGSKWRLTGAPPVPHVFASEVDEQAMAKSLDPQAEEYLSNSGFVWQMLNASGWTVPYLDVVQLVAAPELASTEAPLFGDIAVYYDGTEPYHVGFVDDGSRVLSATLNAGLRRTSFDAFPGSHRYFRLRTFAIPGPPPASESAPDSQLPEATRVE